MEFKIFGPETGSTMITVDNPQPNRVRVLVTTDFNEGVGILTYEGARQMRDALDELLRNRK